VAISGRLGLALRGELTGEQRALRSRILDNRSSDLDRIAPDGRDGVLDGPFGPMLLAPSLGDVLQQLGAELRFDGTLAADVREMVTLYVAGHRSSAFELFVHQRLALKEGVPGEVVDALSSGQRPADLSASEASAVDLARAILARDPISDDLFLDALTVLGPQTTFEVVVLCGYYNLIADILHVFGIGGDTSS
jgi:alkylhydroperoxidase family enzyme